MITKKFQEVFDSMKSNEIVSVKLGLSEVSRILALLKSDDAFEKALGDHMDECFIKADNEFKEGLKKYE